MSDRTDELNKDECLKADASALMHHLFGSGSSDLGFIGVGDNEWIVYIYSSKKRWRGPTPMAWWRGWPVRFRFNVGYVVALDAE